MKRVFKHVLVGVAFLSAGVAQAAEPDVPWAFWGLPGSASGNLVLSSDASSGVATAGVNVYTDAIIPSVPGLPGAGARNAASSIPTEGGTWDVGQLNFQFSSLSYSDDRSALSRLTAPQSLVEFSRTKLDKGQVVAQYSVFLAGFDWDLATSTIYANLYTTDTVSKAFADLGRQAIFQASQQGIVGGTQGKVVVLDSTAAGTVKYGASGSLAGDLRLTTSALDLILGGLSVPVQSTVGDVWRTANWGTASFNAPAVPEPSTYALFGAGLLAIGALARRRQATT